MRIGFLNIGFLAVGAVIISASGPALAGDYSGGSVTKQPARESNTHNPGMGIDQGTLSASLFNQLDRNQDQKLSGDELKSYDSGPEGQLGGEEEPKNRTLLKNHDLNDDGVITLEEFKQSNNSGQ